MPDGSAVQINWHRGNQTLDTGIKILTNKRAYFLQKFQMKTSIDFIGNESCPKLTTLILNQVDESMKKSSVIGECIIDLSKFIDWVEKKSVVHELSNGKAKVEFQIKSL
jgi:hypothetical protein